MKKLFYLTFLLLAGASTFSFADNNDCDENEAHPRKQRVRLFYSSDDNKYDELDEPQDPRDDYEWPGANESSLFDSLTR
jgi:hypothetical protein